MKTHMDERTTGCWSNCITGRTPLICRRVLFTKTIAAARLKDLSAARAHLAQLQAEAKKRAGEKNGITPARRTMTSNSARWKRGLLSGLLRDQAAPAYLDKTNATAIHAALALDESAMAFDMLGSIPLGRGRAARRDGRGAADAGRAVGYPDRPPGRRR